MAHRQNSWINSTKHYNLIGLSSYNCPSSNPLFNYWNFSCGWHACLVPLPLGLVLFLGSYAWRDGWKISASYWQLLSLGDALRSWLWCFLRRNLGSNLHAFHSGRRQFYKSFPRVRLCGQFSFCNTGRVLSRGVNIACMQRSLRRLVCYSWPNFTFRCDRWKQHMGNAGLRCHGMVMAWYHPNDTWTGFWSFCSNTARSACCEQVSLISTLTALVVSIFWGQNGIPTQSKVKKWLLANFYSRLQTICFGLPFGSLSKKWALSQLWIKAL